MHRSFDSNNKSSEQSEKSCMEIAVRTCGCISAFYISIVAFLVVITPTLNAKVDDWGFGNVVPTSDNHATVIENYAFGFKGQAGQNVPRNQHLKMGPEVLLPAVLPKWANALVQSAKKHFIADWRSETYKANLTINDAREANTTFAETGFALRSVDYNEDEKTYQKSLEAEILKMYPQVKSFEWGSALRRGPKGNQPATNGDPHIDYTQNDTARQEFYSTRDSSNSISKYVFTGLIDNEEVEGKKLRVIMGLWKPHNMDTPICDRPLALMDARTFKANEEVSFGVKLDMVLAQQNMYVGGILHHPRQKWYYFPYQTNDEVLFWHHYTSGEFRVNPHTSFANPNCPEGFETRSSQEMRVALYW